MVVSRRRSVGDGRQDNVAYDKTLSDAIYGGGGRYVSLERLQSMLAHE